MLFKCDICRDYRFLYRYRIWKNFKIATDLYVKSIFFKCFPYNWVLFLFVFEAPCIFLLIAYNNCRFYYIINKLFIHLFIRFIYLFFLSRQKFPRLESKNVQFWFKNRRAKCKRLKMSLYDTNQCSQLTGLNSFVHKYDERD